MQVQVPSAHQSGLDWYHPHHHMATSDQVYGGLAGAIQVGDPLDPWPQYVGKYNERLLALSTPLIDHSDPNHPDNRVLDDPSPGPAGVAPTIDRRAGADRLKPEDGREDGVLMAMGQEVTLRHRL
jgi:FtsP/CotA-like multicopper oxidase with cupredoxin domain